ncbi:MAG: hypothetical protein ACJAWL_001350 [Motiliproteus sp.]|jgi:hypothetical protein
MELLSSITNSQASIALLIFAILFTYFVFAKRWSACTGRYVTEGKVLWSSYDYLAGSKRPTKVGIIDFNYWVNGELFHSNYYCPKVTGDYYVKKYPGGSVIPVFYSIKKPGYCVIDKPPSSFQVLFGAIRSFIITPLIIANTGLFIWHLF